jgi:hypothetical protein
MNQKEIFFSILKLHLWDRKMFSLREVYLISEGPMSFHYPFNNHIRDKIRELLQVLRDEGHLQFIKKGFYQWNPISAV